MAILALTGYSSPVISDISYSTVLLKRIGAKSSANTSRIFRDPIDTTLVNTKENINLFLLSISVYVLDISIIEVNLRANLK